MTKKRYPILFNIPLRTKKILEEAEELEKNKFFSSAILRYTNYLEQFLVIASLSYCEKHDHGPVSEVRKCVMNTKINKKFTFHNIIGLMPDKIKTDGIKQLCKEIKNIRNQIGAHDYFVIALDKTRYKQRRFDDVNSYRKFIRNLYKLIKKTKTINQAENFLLLGHPLTIYSTLEEKAYDVEMIIMESICMHTRKTVQNVCQKIEHELYRTSPDPNLNKYFSRDC